MPLNPKFQSAVQISAGFFWLRQEPNAAITQSLLAEELAEYIMKFKLGRMINHFNGWQMKRVNNQITNPPATILALESIIRPCIGLRSNPKPDDHIQGWVSEHLWYFLIKGSYTTSIPQVKKLFGVGLSSTDPGGDGLVFYERPDGTLIFRLWELKKISDVSTGNINSTITKAIKQLEDNGPEYLMRFTTENQDTELTTVEKSLIDKMIDEWYSKSDRAGAGVSVSGSDSKLMNANFNGLPITFPHFSTHGTLEARSIVINNFNNFCNLVCDNIWKGI